MNTLKLLTTALLLIMTAAAACADSASSLAKPVEGRAVWVDANSIPTNDKDMAAFVDSFARANLNVLIPETMRRGFVIYPSNLDDQDPRFIGFDPLASMIREAHKRKMEVHPWVWVFRQGYKDHPGPIFTRHPNWMAVNKWGETLSANSGYWICPSIPEARDYLLSVFKEIVTKYDVDGLHLDYIRFESESPAPYCYNASCRDKFKAKYGVDPMDVNPLTPMQANWHLWREDLVNTFVRQISQETRAIKPDLKISAAVGSDPDTARTSLLQNWNHWVDNKWLDFLTPMAYTADPDSYRKLLVDEKTAVNDRTILMPGIGLHTQKTPDQMLRQVDIARELGADGVTLFAALYLSDAGKSALAGGPFAAKAEVPFRNPVARVKTLLKAAHKVVRQNPSEAVAYLTDASRLLHYVAYRTQTTPYIAPTPPPLEIPSTIIPLPTVEVPRAASAPTIDGKLDDPAWAAAASIKLSYTQIGQQSPVATEVLLTHDDACLYIAYKAQEPAIDDLQATVTKRDGPTFYDDSVEFFLDPWARRRDYFQLSANTLGTQFDARVSNPGINLNWSAAAAKSDNQWTEEITVPFLSLGVPSPKPGDAWFANFARNRWVTGSPEFIVWAVPYGGFHNPERFGTLVFR